MSEQTPVSDAELDAMMQDLEVGTSTTAKPADVVAPGGGEVGKAPERPASQTGGVVTPPSKDNDATLLKSFIDPDQVKVDISINTADLDSAMIGHSALELHYAMQTAHARRQYERIKAALEILEARLDSEVRENWVGEKKPTEAAIKAAIYGDKRYSAAQGKLIDAQHIWKLCEASENAFRSRKDLLLEVARDRRKEKEGQMRVLEATTNREAMMDMINRKKAN